MTLSTPVKIVALAALALALGLGGVTLMFGRHSSPPPARAATPPATVHIIHTVAPVTPRPKPKAHKPAVQVAAGTPAAIAVALDKAPTFVTVVYSSRVAGDRAVLAEAIAGARAAHVPWIAFNVARPSIAEALAVSSWSQLDTAPSVFVIRRPGRVVFAVSGPTDRTTVAQAALTAR